MSETRRILTRLALMLALAAPAALPARDAPPAADDPATETRMTRIAR